MTYGWKKDVDLEAGGKVRRMPATGGAASRRSRVIAGGVVAGTLETVASGAPR